MPYQISWKLEAKVANGPQSSASNILAADGYDLIHVEVPAGAGSPADTVVSAAVQPSDKVHLLMIVSSAYDEKLTYSVNDPEPTEKKRIVLDSPLLLIGAGAIGLLGVPTSLYFYNGTDTTPTPRNASITILVGRDNSVPATS